MFIEFKLINYTYDKQLPLQIETKLSPIFSLAFKYNSQILKQKDCPDFRTSDLSHIFQINNNIEGDKNNKGRNTKSKRREEREVVKKQTKQVIF